MLSTLTVRNYWSSLLGPSAWPRFGQNSERPFLVESKQVSRVWLRTYFQVLRRDHYRCRGCDKKAGEVTLKIHQIRSGPLQMENALTLCLGCKELAINLELKGFDIPDFLRHLWHYLYHRIEPNHI